MNWVDLGVLALLLVSGLLGAMRGLVREVLGVAAWAAAAFVAGPYGAFPSVAPWVRRHVSDPGIADAAAFFGVFLIVLILLWLVVRTLSNAVRGSALGGLDRTLGLVFGLGRGAALLVVAYILLGIGLGAVGLAPPGRRRPGPAGGRPRVGERATAASLLRASPVGRALGARPTRE